MYFVVIKILKKSVVTLVFPDIFISIFYTLYNLKMIDTFWAIYWYFKFKIFKINFYLLGQSAWTLNTTYFMLQ